MANIADTLLPTGLRTDGLLDQAIERALRSGGDTVFLLSDQPIALSDRRIVRITPELPLQDAGISLIAARETPTAQVMVRVLNQSNQTAGTLDVLTAGQRVRRAIQLPPKAAFRDYFFTPPELGETIEASLTPDGGLPGEQLPADDRAWLARVARWPAIESRIPLDPAIERMVSVYTRRRPPAEGSPTIQIVANPQDLAGGQRGVVVNSSFADTATNGTSLEVTDHAITRGINWGHCRCFPRPPTRRRAGSRWFVPGARRLLLPRANPFGKCGLASRPINGPPRRNSSSSGATCSTGSGRGVGNFRPLP